MLVIFPNLAAIDHILSLLFLRDLKWSKSFKKKLMLIFLNKRYVISHQRFSEFTLSFETLKHQYFYNEKYQIQLVLIYMSLVFIASHSKY